MLGLNLILLSVLFDRRFFVCSVKIVVTIGRT